MPPVHRPIDEALENLRNLLADVESRVPNLGLVLGCDCILRRLET